VQKCNHILNNILGHPRLILAMFATTMAVIAVSKFIHPPVWFNPEAMLFPFATSIITLAGAVACLVAIVRPSMWTMAFAGAALAGAIATRGFGLTAILVMEPWAGSESWSYLIGDLAWMTFLAVLPPLWSKHLIPWAVAKEVAKGKGTVR
jgi:hypothetical protein